MDRRHVGSARIIRGNALALPLADESVDLVVTSPPYFGLRSYQDGGSHYAGQIGSEATPAEFVDALVAATREMVRVLKPTGSIWVNLGDKYNSAASGQNGIGRSSLNGHGDVGTERDRALSSRGGSVGAVPQKSLIGVPWRYALRCIDDLGLILRAEVIWSKCLSGGTEIYARVAGREKVMTVKDLARCAPGSAELWTGQKWSSVLRCDPTPPTAGRAASSAAARSARYRGKPVPALVADLEIEFRNGERIGCTPNHKWPTARGIVRADELTVGDVIPTTRLPAGTAAPSGLEDELTGWLVGLYIAEGSRSEDMVQIASHIREQDRFDRLAKIAEAFDGRFALHHTKGNAATANLSGKVIRAILDTYVGGRTSGDKRLSPACWRRSDTFLRAVLDGYLSGDGHYDVKADRWVLGFTANDGLATDLRVLAARLGYSLRLRRTIHKFDGRDFPGWGGTLYHDPSRRKRPDSEVVAIRQSRARQFWNIEIADEPHEFALACGILTENSNGLPESVTDRVRRSHETWFHFTRSPRYYSAVDEIREEHAEPNGRPSYGRARPVIPGGNRGAHVGTMDHAAHRDMGQNPLGKLPGSVWTVPTQPLKVPASLGIDHFAAFPMEWPRRIIQGWSPAGVCTACGEGRRPVTHKKPMEWRESPTIAGRQAPGTARKPMSGTMLSPAETTITGYVCACTPFHTEDDGSIAAPAKVYDWHLWTDPPPTTPAVVLDPFGGTGTTPLVAKVLGRDGVQVDMSADYCRLAQWRTTDPGEIARAMQVEKPAVAPPGQMSMFDLMEEETAS